MLSLVLMIVLWVVGSCGLRLEDIGRPKLEINERSRLREVEGSILEKVKAALKREELGLEAKNGKGGGDGKEEVVERGDERRKKKRRVCRGKAKGTNFKVSCNLLAEKKEYTCAFFLRRGRVTLRDVSPTHVKGPLQQVWKKPCFIAIHLELFCCRLGKRVMSLVPSVVNNNK